MHLLEKAIAELPEGGETLVGIFDLRGFGNRNADLGFVRFLVRSFAPPAVRLVAASIQHQFLPVSRLDTSERAWSVSLRTCHASNDYLCLTT